jgi:hypothetical protein
MSQVVEPIEVTYKRALTLWWNITCPTLGTLFILGIFLGYFNGIIESIHNHILASIVGICFGLFWLFLIIWVPVVVIQGLFIHKFKDFRIIMVKREITPEDEAIAQQEQIAKEINSNHRNIT